MIHYGYRFGVSFSLLYFLVWPFLPLMVAHMLYALAFYFVCRFLFDESCADYKYYEYQLAIEEKVLQQTSDSQTSRNG